GETTGAYTFAACGETLDLASLQEVWESALEDVFPYRSKDSDLDGPASGDRSAGVETVSFTGGVPLTYNGRVARPRVVIPVFPGTNCEYDTARAFEAAGAVAEVLVVNNLTPERIAESTRELARAIGNSQ